MGAAHHDSEQAGALAPKHRSCGRGARAMSWGHREEARHAAGQFQMPLYLEWGASARSRVGAGMTEDRQTGRDAGRPTEKG